MPMNMVEQFKGSKVQGSYAINDAIACFRHMLQPDCLQQ
jgi:hypothetical protein